MEYIDNSKWWKHLLTFKGRASRTEYNLICLACILPLGIAIYGMKAYHWFYGNENFLTWLLIYLVVMLYVLFAAFVRRNHDLGNSGIKRYPFSHYDYTFRKGQKGMNRFGSDPCQDYDVQLKELEESEA